MTPRRARSRRPASLKGVLSPREAAAALAAGLRASPVSSATKLPVADGGEGTVDVLCDARRRRAHGARTPFGRPRDRRASATARRRRRSSRRPR